MDPERWEHPIGNNNSRIPAKDLKRVMEVIEVYSDLIVAQWEQYFGVKAKYIDET